MVSSHIETIEKNFCERILKLVADTQHDEHFYLLCNL